MGVVTVSKAITAEQRGNVPVVNTAMIALAELFVAVPDNAKPAVLTSFVLTVLNLAEDQQDAWDRLKGRIDAQLPITMAKRRELAGS